MFNNYKIKYKFNISFYIFFIFFLIIFIKFSTSIANAKTYKVEDLEISKTYDNDFNKEVVIDMAFKKAFEQIILRITTTNGEKLAKSTNLKTIYSLIESFSIVDEKFIDNKYVSKFEVDFSKKELFKYLEKKNIYPSIPKEKTLLLIPLLINNEKKQILLFSENPLYNNWNKTKKKHHLLNYILPNEDIEDRNFIKKNFELIEEYNFKEIIKKYDLNNYIIMIVYRDNNQLKVLSKIHLNDDFRIINKSYENINLNDKKSLEVFIKDIKNEYEDSWKDLNKINTSIKLPLTVTIESKDIEKIKLFEKTLNNLDLVSYFYIMNFNSKQILYKVIYNGSPNKFLVEIKDSGLLIKKSDQSWRIE